MGADLVAAARQLVEQLLGDPDPFVRGDRDAHSRSIAAPSIDDIAALSIDTMLR
jgi:hypothetical protein